MNYNFKKELKVHLCTNLPKYYNVSDIDKPNAAIDALDALATFQEVVVNNCDSTEGWECYPGDTLEFTDTKKTEGAGSIYTAQSGGLGNCFAES